MRSEPHALPLWLIAIAAAVDVGLGAVLTIVGLELLINRDLLPIFLPPTRTWLGAALFGSMALLAALGCPIAFALGVASWRPRRGRAVGLLILCAVLLVGSALTWPIGLAALKGYQQSVQIERTTYRLIVVYPPVSPSDIHHVELNVYQCDALGLVCHLLHRAPNVEYDAGFYPRLLVDSQTRLLEVEVYGDILYTYHQP